jgi:hypothetical protein
MYIEKIKFVTGLYLFNIIIEAHALIVKKL